MSDDKAEITRSVTIHGGGYSVTVSDNYDSLNLIEIKYEEADMTQHIILPPRDAKAVANAILNLL